MMRLAAAVLLLLALAPGEGRADSSWRRPVIDLTKLELVRNVGRWYTHSLSPGASAFAVFDANVARLIDLGDGRQIQALKGHTAPLHDSGWSHDGQFLATTAYDAAVTVWDVRKGKAVHSFSPHAGFACSVAFSDDGRRLATGGSEDGLVRLIDTSTWAETRSIPVPDSAVYTLAFTPDGRHLVLIHSVTNKIDNNLKVYRTSDGVEVPTAATGVASTFALSPDGKRLAYSSGAGSIAILETSRWSEVGRLPGHQSATTSIAYHSSGRWLASAGRDGAVRIWDGERQQQIHALAVPGESEGRLMFSADGTELIVANALATVRVYGRRPTLIPAPLPGPPGK